MELNNIDSLDKAIRVMETSPFILGELETAILSLETKIGDREGQIIIDNKDEKQSVQKAIIKTDTQLNEARMKLAELQGKKLAWTSAFQSSKAFHKSMTNS